MKAEEMMIGDWVKVSDWYNEETFSKVERVYPYSIETTDNERVEEEDISPIPITPEILEKNGFQRYYDTHHACYSYEYINIKTGDCIYFLHLPCGIFELKISDNEYYRNIKINVSYIHELQHALCLCKIEKEIVL